MMQGDAVYKELKDAAATTTTTTTATTIPASLHSTDRFSFVAIHREDCPNGRCHKQECKRLEKMSQQFA